jgi:DNA repair photolyase
MISDSPRRGAVANPAGRFEKRTYEPSEPGEPLDTSVPTQLHRDRTRDLLSKNDSPDLGFDTSINPYRGCEHGCSYCYARPTHEYLGFSAGLDFETHIFVKEDAPERLERAFSRRGYRPRVIALSGVTDAYQPIEQKLRITRRLLQVFRTFRNPVTIVTKGALIVRDVDLLAELAQHDLVSVSISVTTLDRNLQRRLEPRASTPERRLAAVQTLSEAGVPTGVMMAPIIPGLTDHEIAPLLEAAARHDARWARYVMLRLPHGLRELFQRWLEKHEPARRAKVMQRLREMHGATFYDSNWSHRQRGRGVFADEIASRFEHSARRHGLHAPPPELSVDHFRRLGAPQLDLFP